MLSLPKNASDEQVLDIIRCWIELLAREDYQAACAELCAWSMRGVWTPEHLRDDIKRYRSPEYYPGVEDFAVTDWRTAQGGNPEPQQKVIWYKPNRSGLGGAVSFDLPLNGRWSNLTVDFVFFENYTHEQRYILVLEEIVSWDQRKHDIDASES